MKFTLNIISKDARRLKICFETEEIASRILLTLSAYVYPEKMADVFAFSHKMTIREIEGWNIFIDVEEYERMGINFSKDVFFISFIV